ncbi:hypothetical protein [Polyangium jinanense]|uniref:Lipoprotein n=1 Tax=Polyangium jinanense TaxID=2829994 RepID=A0A9X4APJ6_9BACT|nr:hypothetical protein [Polyangium jinanense]MDC3952450.1 hypothetical protein [Polyangium jinanense]MDC3980078.1 hypothetical protein [Polyangium jinanense]
MRRVAALGGFLTLAAGCAAPTVPTAPALFVVTNGIGSGEMRVSMPKEGCGVDCLGVMGKGAALRIIGHPHPGSRFDGFSGPCTGRMPCVLPFDRQRWVAASFSDAAARYDRPLGDGRFFVSSPRAVALDKGGGGAVVGVRDAWLGRFDREGQKAWDLAGDNRAVTAVVFDAASDIVAVGGARVEKRGASGGPLWVFDFEWGSKATDVAVDAAGDIYVVGTFAGVVKVGKQRLESAGGLDVFVARISPEGKPIEALRMGGPTDEREPRIATEGSSAVHVAYVAGGLEDEFKRPDCGAARIVSFAPFGQKAWEAPIEGKARVEVLRTTTGGEVVAAGRFADGIKLAGMALRSNGGNDAMVVKLDRNGGALWAKSFGGTRNDEVSALDVDSSGRIALFGTFEAEMKVSGTTLQAKRIRRTWQHGMSFDGTTLDAWFSVLSPEGEVRSAKAFGGSGNDFALAVTWAEGGDVVLLFDQEELSVSSEGYGPGSSLQRRLVRRPAEAP